MLTEENAKESLREAIRNRRVGPWMLTEPLGRGGQGQTWRALRRDARESLTRQVLSDDIQQWQRLGDRAVIKLMLPPSQAEWRVPADAYPRVLLALQNQFVSECDLLASITSPFVPAIYERGMQATQAGWAVPWAAIELIEGTSLGAQLQRTGPFDLLRWLELAHDILAALEAIHSAGLVHLDLKPDNVMLEPMGARVIDFGLAQRQMDVIGKGISGTVGYFAPEQLDDVVEERDFAFEVDLFKAGVTLALAAGIRQSTLWSLGDRPSDRDVRDAMRRGPRLGGLAPPQRQLLETLLAFAPEGRGSAAAALARVQSLLPSGSRRASEKPSRADDKRLRTPSHTDAAPASHVANATDPSGDRGSEPDARPNIGARVIAQDQLGLLWPGEVVGADPRRVRNVLVRHASTRGLNHVRSYSGSQIVKGAAFVASRAEEPHQGAAADVNGLPDSVRDLREVRAKVLRRYEQAAEEAQRRALKQLLDRLDAQIGRK